MVLLALHTRISEILVKEGKSFNEYLKVYGSDHRIYVMRSVAFIKQIGASESILDNIYPFHVLHSVFRYAGHGIDHFGMVNETLDVWLILLSFVYESAEKNNESDDKQIIVALSYSQLVKALKQIGKYRESIYMLARTLSMYCAVHDADAVHSNIASSQTDLGNVYTREGDLDDAELMHKQSLHMYRTIHGEGSTHTDIAKSLTNLRNVYDLLGNLDEVEFVHEKT